MYIVHEEALAWSRAAASLRFTACDRHKVSQSSLAVVDLVQWTVLGGVVSIDKCGTYRILLSLCIGDVIWNHIV